MTGAVWAAWIAPRLQVQFQAAADGTADVDSGRMAVIAAVAVVTIVALTVAAKPLIVRFVSAANDGAPEHDLRPADAADDWSPVEPFVPRIVSGASSENAWPSAGAWRDHPDMMATAAPTLAQADALSRVAAALFDGRGMPLHAADEATVAAITATVRELLACANEGRLLSGFALYSEDLFRRFATESGLSTAEFLSAYMESARRAPTERAKLAGLGDLAVLADGRITAVVHYYTATSVLPPERYTFIRAPHGDGWQIDEIAPIAADPQPSS